MITLEGVAFLTSGATDITTVIVKINNGFAIKYYYLGIKDWVDEETDIQRTIKYGQTLHPKVGEAAIEHCGSSTLHKYKEKIDTNINLRNVKHGNEFTKI
jgi:hypothetical protein